MKVIKMMKNKLLKNNLNYKKNNQIKVIINKYKLIIIHNKKTIWFLQIIKFKNNRKKFKKKKQNNKYHMM